MSDPKVNAESAGAAGEAFVSATCAGELCSMCGELAARKVGEEIPLDDPHPHRHNLTAYVCAEHFAAIFSYRGLRGAVPSVRVRIAVAVDPSGNWCASGWMTGSPESMMDNCLDEVGAGEARFWIEADVPPPLAPQTIRGSVTASAEERCPDGLSPDGPVCPRCGKSRAPSGIDGGTWVHFDGIQGVNGVPVAAEGE